MNRSTRDAVAFGLGFLTGALLLAMLMGLQVRVAQARAEQFRAEAEAQRDQATAARMVAEEQTPWGGSRALMTEYGSLDEGLNQPSPDASTPQSLGLGPSVG